MARDLQIEMTFSFTLGELSERSGSSPDFILDLVDLGVLHPLAPTEPLRFDSRALARLLRANRLRKDLNINTAGIATSLDLLEEVEQLRQEVAFLRRLLSQLGNI